MKIKMDVYANKKISAFLIFLSNVNVHILNQFYKMENVFLVMAILMQHKELVYLALKILI